MRLCSVDYPVMGVLNETVHTFAAILSPGFVFFSECVKDLIRYLRKDDENHEIRRALGETKVVLKDLIPIIKHHSGDEELLDVTLR